MTSGQAVWLYGSYARGDESINSDVDILIAGKGDPPDAIHDVYPACYKAISQYSWREIERMADYGSVFLHHVRTEAFPLLPCPAADRRLADILVDLGPYHRAASDLEAFRATLDDVRQALEGDCAPDYESAVLGSVARHASVLVCFLAGGPVYGRTEAFSRLESLLDLPTDPKSELLRIYDYRLAEERGIPLRNRASEEEVRRDLALVQSIVDGMEELVHDYSRTVYSRA
jgi:hypothetical protein